jgi:type I restriction enzyme S subunit
VTMFKAESYVGHKLCRPDDLAINTMWAWMGALGVSKHTGIISPSYGVYRPARSSPLQSRFADALLRTPQYVAEYVCRSTGIRSSRLRLYPESFLRIPLVYPSSDEQAAIVKFIDHADRRVRRYIRAKQKLIKLLEEQKQAIIHQAVTQGLDPNVRLKPSGIEWLGKVPEHWGVQSIKRLARQGAHTFTDGDWVEIPHITDSGVRLLQTGNVGRGYLREKGFRYVSDASFVELKCTEVLPGDVLICRLDGPVGRACVAPDLGCRMITSVDNTILKLGPIAHGGFVAHVLSTNAWLNWLAIISRAGGGFRYRVSRTGLGSLRIPVPPVDEQVAIREMVDASVQQLMVVIRSFERKGDLLREYRTRLIADIVTGKLDVREAAAALPDETDTDSPDLEETDDTVDKDAEAPENEEAAE